MKYLLRFLILLGLTFQARASLLDSGLEISLAGDLVYNQGLSEQSSAQEKLTMRSAELMFTAPVDPYWNANFSLAAHEESGQMNFELHELFVENHQLIPRTRLRVGQFFLGIGRLNRFHQHDWPFTRAPKVHRDFLGEEAVFDSGLELQSLLPTPFFLQLTTGLTSGYRYGHVHSAGTKPKVPTHYLRLNSFKSFSGANGAEFGVSYLGRTNSQSEKMHLLGADLTAKWRQGKILKWLVSGEVWHRTLKFSNAATQEEMGAYLFVQRGLSAFSSLGIRFDGMKNFTDRNLVGRKQNHIHYGATLQASTETSEFFKTRLSFSHEFERVEGRTNLQDTRVALQLVFILGSHPAHEF